MPKKPPPASDHTMRIELYQDLALQWRWRGVDGNHRIICDGSEGYVSRDSALRAVDNVMVEFRGPVVVVARDRRRYGVPNIVDPAFTQLTERRSGLRSSGPVWESYEELAEYQPEGAKK